jgi:hypothetical protein
MCQTATCVSKQVPDKDTTSLKPVHNLTMHIWQGQLKNMARKFSPSPYPPYSPDLVPSDYNQILLHRLYHQGGNWHWAPSNDMNKANGTVVSKPWKPLTHYLIKWQELPPKYTTLALQPWQTEALLPYTSISSLSSGKLYQQVCLLHTTIN